MTILDDPRLSRPTCPGPGLSYLVVPLPSSGAYYIYGSLPFLLSVDLPTTSIYYLHDDAIQSHCVGHLVGVTATLSALSLITTVDTNQNISQVFLLQSFMLHGISCGVPVEYKMCSTN